MKYMIETPEELLRYLEDVREEGDKDPFIGKNAHLDVDVRDGKITMKICQDYTEMKTVHTKDHDSFIFSEKLNFSDVFKALAKHAGFKNASFSNFVTKKLKDA